MSLNGQTCQLLAFVAVGIFFGNVCVCVCVCVCECVSVCVCVCVCVLVCLLICGFL